MSENVYDLVYRVHFQKDEDGLFPEPEDVYDMVIEDFKEHLTECMTEMLAVNALTKGQNE